MQIVKFCYDCGHNNVFDRNFDYFKEYGDKLITLHLHDNDGKEDLHTLTKICQATVDWDMIGRNLKNHKDINLDYEFLDSCGSDMTAEEFLAEAFIQAKSLEKMIENEN